MTRWTNRIFVGLVGHSYNPIKKCIDTESGHLQIVMDLAYARIVSTKVKPGQREEALRIIDEAPKEKVEGFMGIIALLDEEDPDSMTVISVWDSKKTMDESSKSIFVDVMNNTKDVREGTPEVKNAKIREMRGQLVRIPA
jgi:quinol monooxygenase YgiN